MTFHIKAEQSGKTVLSFLKSTLKISASALAKLKRDPIGIMANGTHVTVRYVLQENDVLFIHETDSEESSNTAIAPVDLPIRILFENSDVLLVDKPPYMPTHPSHDHENDTLANAVAFLYSQKQLPFVFRPIGRLDRNTSGISLLAKNLPAASFLFHARQKKLIHKKYIAIVRGRLDSGDDYQVIETYIKRQADSIIVRCVGTEYEEGAQIAVTHWKTLYASDEISVVEAIPITGRTHQLRVHFSHLGHPILGDDIYGEASPLIGRHALHAAFLSIPLPYGEKIVEFVSMPPEDMQKAFFDITATDLLTILKNPFNKEKDHHVQE